MLFSHQWPSGLIVFCILVLGVCTSPPPQAPVSAPASPSHKAPLLDPSRYNVAFLIMNGTFNTELTAPFDIFHHTRFREEIKAMNVFLIANTLAPITTFEGIQVLPDFDYLKDTLPHIDILVVPSAEHHLDTDLKDTALIKFVQRIGREARFVTSHCDGAFVLAKAGLLDGITCTTYPDDIPKLREMFPQLNVQENVYFVHDGKFITSAGGARSFEAALYLCELLYGKQVAEQLAHGLVIDWDLKTVPYKVY